jgi:chemotaxis protein methyltransferase CheR
MQVDLSLSASTLSSEQLQALQQIFETQFGLDFTGPRQRNLQAGIAAMANSLGMSAGDCASQLAQQLGDGALAAQCARHFTVAETYFFREARAFQLISEVARDKFDAQGQHARLRIWSAGCCTGEECYSAAIALQRALPAPALARCSVLGTDINAESLRLAESAVYGRRSFRQGEAPGALHFAAAGQDMWQVSSPARDMVQFARHNLADGHWPLYLQGMDIILCRNVLMYFSPDQARQCIARLRDCLVEGGWLIVSPSEAASELFAGFEVVRHPDAIWFRKISRTALSAPQAIGTGRECRPDRQVSRAQAPVRARAGATPGPDNDRLRAQAYCRQAATHAEAGESGQACAHLRRALYLDPDCVLANWLLGMLLAGEGRLREARPQLQAAARQLQRMPPEAAIPGAESMSAGSLQEATSAMLASLETQKLVA